MAVQGQMKTRSHTKVREPKKYRVVMHNDDYTPMDFVVEILIEIFDKNEETAVELMYQVHRGNRAVVGVYSYDIASTKVRQATERARAEGYPFRVTMEEA